MHCGTWRGHARCPRPAGLRPVTPTRPRVRHPGPHGFSPLRAGTPPQRAPGATRAKGRLPAPPACRFRPVPAHRARGANPGPAAHRPRSARRRARRRGRRPAGARRRATRRRGSRRRATRAGQRRRTGRRRPTRRTAARGQPREQRERERCGKAPDAAGAPVPLRCHLRIPPPCLAPVAAGPPRGRSMCGHRLSQEGRTACMARRGARLAGSADEAGCVGWRADGKGRGPAHGIAGPRPGMEGRVRWPGCRCPLRGRSRPSAESRR